MTTDPHFPDDGSTWELAVSFAGDDARERARVKRETLAWLGRAGFDAIAEGVVDGVDVKVSDVDVDVAFGDGDATAVLVFDASRERLLAASAALTAQFGDRIVTRLAELADQSWQRAWDGTGDETFVAGDFAIVNQGAQAALPEGLTPIIVERSEAFGDGRHATTLAALEVLSLLRREGRLVQRGAALDVGTGSGVLAIAAAHLGYGPIVATEIDAEALAVAGRNARRAEIPIALELSTAALPPQRASSGERFTLIVANILVPVLHDLLPRLAESLAANGALVLAGFVEKEAAPLLAAAAKVGLGPIARVERRGWLGVALARTDNELNQFAAT